MLVLTIVASISVKAMLLVIDCKYALMEKRLPTSGHSKVRRKSPIISNAGEMFFSSGSCDAVVN